MTGQPPFGPDATWTPGPSRPWLKAAWFRGWQRRRQLARRRVREFDRFGFRELATYNAETYRGLVHTPAMQAKMAAVQAQFDQWAQEVRDD